MKRLPSGYELWRGPSRFDGEPIVLLAKLESTNSKTGPMATLYVMRQDIPPVEAVENGRDRAICGMCPLRPALGGNCYVDAEKATGKVWAYWNSGKGYKQWPGSLQQWAEGLYVRLTAYGDIDALPRHVPESIIKVAKGHTAYTEGWSTAPRSWRAWCMASVHSAVEAEEARAMGWRTYRDRDPTEPLGEREDICPYQESKQRTRCIECLRCSGGVGRSIVIDRH